MAEYDESDDIESLLRSAVRGDSANASDTGAGAPTPAAEDDTAARRRRIRFEADDLHPLSEEEQADEARAALLNSSIPEKSRTPMGSKAQSRIDRDLWKDCDRGIAAQRRLTGTHVSWSAAQRVIFMIMQLIPIAEFAPELYEWGPNKTKNATMVKLADTYATMRPAVISVLVGVTNTTGAEARSLIDDAKQAIFGGDTIHDICVYALMIYQWSTHPDSAKRATVDTVIDDYLKTPDDQIQKLLAMTKRGKFLNIDDDLEVALKGSWELPGMARLNYQENAQFTKAWLDLWTAVINILCFQEREKQDIGEVNRALSDFIIDSKDHVDCRQNKPVHEVHTNQKTKFMKLAEVCKRMNMPERLPDKYSRAINFLAAIDDGTFNKLEKILEDADNIQDADMTYEKTVKLCLLAENRLKKRISAVTMARQLRRGTSETAKKKEKPETEDKKKKPKEGEKKPLPKKEGAPNSGFLKLPDKVKNLTHEQSEAYSKAAVDSDNCKNCGGIDKRFPKHKSYQCPYENRWGGKWPDRHVTIDMISRTADTDKVVHPVMVPEEPSDIHQNIGNQIPGVEIEENLDSIIESIITPLIIHHPHTEEDEFEPVVYDDETIDCALPVNPGAHYGTETRYVDSNLRLIEPTLKVQVTAMVNDYFIYPLIAMYMALASMAATACDTAERTWRMIPSSVRQWSKWILVTLTLSMIMAAIGIHACNDIAEQHGSTVVPDVEWYSRDDDYVLRRVNENLTKTVACAASEKTNRSRIHTFVAFDKAGNRYRVGVDSYAEISMISTKAIKASWETIDLKAAAVKMSGIGGSKLANKAVTLPTLLQWGQPPVNMTLYVGDTPYGVDILMGLDIQDQLQTVIDRPASTIMFHRQKVNVKTDVADTVTARMRSPPITVVATNAGCNFAYAAVRNAGFRVSKWYSVEADEKCRQITETIVPAAELQHIGHRTEQVGNQIDDVHVDLFIDTSPCQPWSRCNGINAKGFKDSRAETFTHANELYLRLKRTNPNIKHIVENVVPAKHLKKDQETMEKMWESKFHEVNASQWGRRPQQAEKHCNQHMRHTTYSKPALLRPEPISQ